MTDGHAVHLYARRWDASALPAGLHIHRVASAPCRASCGRGSSALLPPRPVRPAIIRSAVGFDKTCGLDVLYPQGGLYVANVDHNLLKYRSPLARRLVRWSN